MGKDMNRHLNLVESDFEHLEKRILPRFPFCFLTFKRSNEDSHAFEVKDISNSGMQLCLKMGIHKLKEGDAICGFLRWGQRELEIQGHIKWATKMRLGVEFSNGASARDEVNQFLKLEHIAKMLKPVHKLDYGIEIPAMLKYWLRSDGPVELFIWLHPHGELARFQILIMENFVEWEDGIGIKTARVISKRDRDTPLISEDEFVFQIDPQNDEEKIFKATTLVGHLESEHLTADVIEFLKIKLRS